MYTVDVEGCVGELICFIICEYEINMGCRIWWGYVVYTVDGERCAGELICVMRCA